jgi:hypothetical protein
MRAGDESAGRRVTCPHCAAVASVPAAGAPAPVPWARPAAGRPPTPAGAWRSFATGCALSRWGAWVEFAGLALGAAVVTYQAVWRDGVGAALGPLRGPLVLAPFFAALVVGAGLVCLGRWKMADVPDGTGAKGVFAAAGVFAALRLLAVAAALFLVLSAADGWANDPFRAGEQVGQAVLAWAAGTVLGALADLPVVPAVAVVGGAVPSPALRRRAGHVTVGLQVVIGLSVALTAGLAYAAEQARAVRPAGADRVRTTAAVGFLVGLQFAYTALFSALYAAGARAEDDARAAGRAVGDEQV